MSFNAYIPVTLFVHQMINILNKSFPLDPNDNWNFVPRLTLAHSFDAAIASRAVIVILSRLDGRAETFLQPAKLLQNGKLLNGPNFHVPITSQSGRRKKSPFEINCSQTDRDRPYVSLGANRNPWASCLVGPAPE